MKKISYRIFAVLAAILPFVACGDYDSSVDHGTHSDLPETVIARTYSGNYEVYSLDGETLENIYPATITIAPGNDDYTITLSSACSEAAMNGAEENPLNVTWANDDIKFWGPTTPTYDVTQTGVTVPDGVLNSAALNGTYSNGELTFRFSKSVRSGRSTTTNFYEFKGER